MTNNLAYTRKTSPDYRQDAPGANINPGPYIGIIKNNIDPTMSGRLQVYIPELGGLSGLNQDDPKNWYTVNYSTPFYGLAPQTQSVTPGVTPVGNPHSYGFWMASPDIGTRVLITFVNGDTTRGYFLACIPEGTNHHMIPAIGASKKFKPTDSEKELYQGATQLPVVEFDDHSPNNKNFTNVVSVEKSVHSIIANQFVKQGTLLDIHRGPISSTSVRETPSLVFGVSTPGRPIPDPADHQGATPSATAPNASGAAGSTVSSTGYYSTLADAQAGAAKYKDSADFARANPSLYSADEMTAVLKFEAASNAEVARLSGGATPGAASATATPKTANPTATPTTSAATPKVKARKGGHTFVMDDGDVKGKNNLIRLRSASGHQIVMSDAEKFLYIQHASGLAWVEITESGQIDVYANNGFNVRTKGNIEFHADENINFNAGGCIHMNSECETTIQSGGTVSIIGSTVLVTSDSSLALNAGSAINMQGGSDVTAKAGGCLKLGADKIYLNSGSVPSAAKASKLTMNKLADTIFDGKKWVSQPNKINTVVNRAPTHEPWPMHENIKGYMPPVTCGNPQSANKPTGAEPGTPSSGNISPRGNTIPGQAGGTVPNGPGTPVGPVDPSKLTPQSSFYGNGQCVALVQTLDPSVGHTSTWVPGQSVQDAVQSNNPPPIGTPIATFNQSTGTYTNSSDGTSHAALYAGAAPDGSGIYIYDQYTGSSSQTPNTRFVAFNNGKSPANNGSSFQVIGH